MAAVVGMVIYGCWVWWAMPAQSQAQPAAVASRNVDLEDCSSILFTHADTSVTVSMQLNKSDVRIEHPGIAVCLK